MGVGKVAGRTGMTELFTMMPVDGKRSGEKSLGKEEGICLGRAARRKLVRPQRDQLRKV